MNNVTVHGYRNGGPKSYETFRVAWCAVPGVDARTLDFRCAAECAYVAAGVAGVEYVRGAYARDCAVARATVAALAAARREEREWIRLG